MACSGLTSPATHAFDNTYESAMTCQAGSIKWAPNPEIYVTKSLKFLYMTAQDTYVKINGGAPILVPAHNGWSVTSDMASPDFYKIFEIEFTGILSSVEWVSESSSKLQSVYTIWVDDVQLLDKSGA
jgi:hypothetical protein